jgi:hypothetical protein
MPISFTNSLTFSGAPNVPNEDTVNNIDTFPNGLSPAGLDCELLYQDIPGATGNSSAVSISAEGFPSYAGFGIDVPYKFTMDIDDSFAGMEFAIIDPEFNSIQFTFDDGVVEQVVTAQDRNAISPRIRALVNLGYL